MNIDYLRENLNKYYDNNDLDGALNFLSNISNSEKEDDILSEIHYQIGIINYYRNSINDADLNFRKSLNYAPKNEFALLYSGLCKENRGDYIGASKIYKFIFDNFPDFKQINTKVLDSVELVKYKSNDSDDYLTNASNSLDDNALDGFPLISILMLCYNKSDFTIKALEALIQNTNYSNFEILVLDNASLDKTSAYLESYGSRIKFFRSEHNLGFVEGNNYLAQYASGEYFVFLNNDTEVQKDWLNSLFNTFVYYPNAGIAGSKLVYPDGKLQEAGGVIFNDGSGWNYGKGDNPSLPNYNFVREVDYCSGASLMIKSELFKLLGGFDTQYSPAYYEDTDLCFGTRKLGYKVYYNFASVVIHHEGATAGTDLNSGFKKYQIENKEKFKIKWQNELKEQHSPNPENSLQFSDRNKGKRILIIDDMPPLPDRASGALFHYNAVLQMLNLGYNVTYAHLLLNNYADDAAKVCFHDLQMRGVELRWLNYESWWAFRDADNLDEVLIQYLDAMQLEKRKLDLVYIAFWNIAEYFISLIKNYIPNIPIMIDTVDVHYLREMREAELTNDKELIETAINNKKREISVYKKADFITTVSLKDRNSLITEIPEKPIYVLTNVHDSVEHVADFAKRKDLLFVGNFNHKPNEDAVIYFIEEIFPIILKKLPTVKFYVVGSNPTEKIQSISSENIIVTGWVPEITPYLDKCRISVIPLRFGAGIKGKIGESLSHGLPMVSTSVGAEGMEIIDGKHSYVSDNPQEFADKVIDLYQNNELWNNFSIQGKKLISSIYGSHRMRGRLIQLLQHAEKLTEGVKSIEYSPEIPKVSIIVIAFNQIEYTVKCFESIYNNTNVPFELILVDNASTDNTIEIISEKFPSVKILSNNENIGFPAAVNIGIESAIGDYYLLLNNDTIVTPNWLNNMLIQAENDDHIGIVGPISNYVSGPQLDKNATYSNIEDMFKYAEEISAKTDDVATFFPRVAFLCTLIKKELVEMIGGLDERFSPGNFEDDDFCLRASLAGFKTVIAQNVFIHHFGSKSFKKDNKSYDELIERNKQIFVEKWDFDPEDIWINGKIPRKRNIKFPVNKDNFIKYFERTIINFEEQELDLAELFIGKAVQHFHSSKRKNFETILFPEVLNLAANILMLNGKLKEAENCLQESLNIAPNSEQTIQLLVELNFSCENIENARKFIRYLEIINTENSKLNDFNLKLSQMDPDYSVLIESEKLISFKKYEEAQQLLTTILNSAYKIDALNNIAAIFILQKNYSAAAEKLGEILKIDPENEIANENVKYLNQIGENLSVG